MTNAPVAVSYEPSAARAAKAAEDAGSDTSGSEALKTVFWEGKTAGWMVGVGEGVTTDKTLVATALEVNVVDIDGVTADSTLAVRDVVVDIPLRAMALCVDDWEDTDPASVDTRDGATVVEALMLDCEACIAMAEE